MFLNFNSGNQNLGWIITAQIIILFSFLVFNFPKAKIFMGDSGSYLFGSLVFSVTSSKSASTTFGSFSLDFDFAFHLVSFPLVFCSELAFSFSAFS